MSGEEADAKHTVQELIAALEFAPTALGGLVEGGWLQQAGQPLATRNALPTTLNVYLNM